MSARKKSVPDAARSARGRRRSAGGKAASPEPASIALGPMAGFVGYYLRIAQIAFFRDLETALAPFAMTPGRFAVLMVIERNPGLSQTRLARAIRLDRSSMVPVLDSLEAQRFVERRPSPHERRSHALWVTPTGKALLGRITPLVFEHEARMTRGLSDAEKAALVAMLARLEGNGEAS